VSVELEVDRLLVAVHGADPLEAARMVAESFLSRLRTADPATLTPLADLIDPLRLEPPIAMIYHTVAGVTGVRTRRRHASRDLETALRLFTEHQLHGDALYLECAITATLTLIRPHETRPRFAPLIAQLETEPARRARLVAMIGMGDAWAGDLLRGRQGLTEARKLALATGSADLLAEVTSWLVKVEALCGDLTASAAYLAQARELAARAGSTWVARHIAECAAAMHLASGDTEAWAGVLEYLVEAGIGANSGLIFEHRWELATHHALSGDQNLAKGLLSGTPDPPLEWPGSPALPAWRHWIYDPANPQALQRFEASLAGLNRPVERLSRARMAWLIGAQHARLGRRADATRLLEAASSGYAAIGAAGPLTRVIATLNQLHGPQQTVAPPTPTPSANSLTASESKVASAVVAGRSNREAAEQLGITTKTVEFHLGNIFRKLGVRNRTELAARMAHP
jgi:DNA-binding CsgD family transcriptional regulator